MSRILAGALNRDLLRAWAALVLVLWLVLLSARFSVYLGEAVGGRLPTGLILKLTWLKSIGFAVFVMPLALYLALLLVLDHWRRTFEAVALAASGFGPADYVRSLAASVLLISCLNGLLVFFVVPATADAGYRLRAQAAAEHDAGLWTPGHFINLASGNLLLFAASASADGTVLNGVFARLGGRDGPAWIAAAHAVLESNPDGRRSLSFEDGHRYRGTPGRADFEQLDFARFTLDLHAGAADAPFHWDAVATSRLRQASGPAAQAEWQNRFSRPLSALVLSACAIWLGRASPGRGRAGRLALGLLVFGVYFLLLGAAHAFMVKGTLARWPGLWWVHAVPLLMCAAIISARRFGRRA